MTLPSPKFGDNVVFRFGDVLPASRLKLTLVVCAFTTLTAAPPYWVPLAVFPEKLFLKMLVVTGPDPVPEILSAPPCDPAVLPVKVQPVIVTFPRPL